MAKMDIELHWSKAERYLFRPSRSEPALSAAERRTRFRKTGVWPPANPTIIEELDAGSIVARGASVPVSFAAGQPLYLTLLNIYEKHKLSPHRLRDTAMTFAAVYGLLTVHAVSATSEPLGLWENAIDDARTLNKWAAAFRGKIDPFTALRASALRFGNFELHVVPSALDRRPTLKIVPKTLLALMPLQFAVLVSSGARIKNCAHCGQLFAAGGDADRREDAIYCDDAHKERAKNERKKAHKAPSKKRKRPAR
jgi:hypothetical protein